MNPFKSLTMCQSGKAGHAVSERWNRERDRWNRERERERERREIIR